ncbi:MAG: hypothetical protein HC925_05015 [Coleofasciculaceae cyanobacterium SM2_3_26]|nr:hypothetical protein [Coleofasciculaceae cyanobacterium SM2_3_26]
MKEIENALDSYQYRSYSQIRTRVDAQQKLVEYVLPRVPACYALVSPGSEESNDPSLVPAYLRHQIKGLVREGIHKLDGDDRAIGFFHTIAEEKETAAPSHWFG